MAGIPPSDSSSRPSAPAIGNQAGGTCGKERRPKERVAGKALHERLRRTRSVDNVDGMRLDSALLPRTAEYVGTLPQGLRSFVGCDIRNILFEPHARDFSQFAAEPSLPEQVSDLLSGRLSDRRWVPEVVFQTASLVVRDLAFQDDATFYRWVFTTSQETFDKPLLRNLMKLVSPSLTVLGAAKRWGAFHRGSEAVPGSVETVNGRTVTAMELRYPEGLFPRMFLVGLEHAFLAAVMAARAKDARVELGAVETGQATFIASWRK
jgi:hypothetical protein